MEHANLPQPGHPHKLSHSAKMKIVREATKTPVNTLKEFKASAAEMGETQQLLLGSSQELYGRVAKRKPLLKKAD